MADIDARGSFYLGRPYDLAARQTRDEPLLYDSKDLTTHAVCVGMTGSGKTGLCLALLEEAALDGIPAICIDPKGDLGNLLLTFPELRPDDFKPWLDPGEAAREGVSTDELAAKTATTWRDGLAQWGEDGERIRRFRDAVDVAIYTPGSTVGLPLSVLRSFTAPPSAVMADADALREKINGAVSGLLALLDIKGDPLKSREHILLATIFEQAWRAGRSLDMPALIREIQAPPLDRIGLVDLETFYPAKERFELAMSLNNLLAAPSFAAWMQGEPLDIERLLYTADRKPRLSILNIAHLSDTERMFFVTILLSEVLAWVRAQPGTSSLRAILYMDEVYGYFPPSANPPSKTPMLTLLKQARAFGLGCVLATQNPVDLDYKGLSNAGTWFLGRLQTERDKARVLEGLEGASSAAGKAFDRGKMESILAGLGKRVFLMNNVHEDVPQVFQTRWTLSFLRGPLTRDQIQTLMAPRKTATPTSAASASSSMSSTGAGPRPMIPPEIGECFVLSRTAKSGAAYHPAILGRAKIRFNDAKSGIDQTRDVMLLLDVAGDQPQLTWDAAEVADEIETESSPTDGFAFSSLAPVLSQPKTYKSLSTALQSHLYASEKLTLSKCDALKQTSRVDESEAEFRLRLAADARTSRDAALAKLQADHDADLAKLDERRRKAVQKVDKEKADSHGKWIDTIIRVLTLIASVFSKKGRISAMDMNRVGTSARSAGRAAKDRQDVANAEEDLAAIDEKIAELDKSHDADVQRLRDEFEPDRLELTEVVLQPKKTDITVQDVRLAWRVE